LLFWTTYILYFKVIHKSITYISPYNAPSQNKKFDFFSLFSYIYLLTLHIYIFIYFYFH